MGDPVLGQTARELSVEEILSPEIQDLIETMKATMRVAPGVGLAAPQIGKSLQLAVIEDMDLSHLNAQQLAEGNRQPVPFHVIINPRIYIIHAKGWYARILQHEIDPTTADLIDIDGTLAISSGTTLDVRVLPGLYSPPDKYLAIQTTGGISGRFTYELISYPSLTYKLTTLMITSTLL